MVERAQNTRFVLKPLQAIGIIGKGLGQYLDGNGSVEASIERSIHLAHAARTYRAGGEGHPRAPLYILWERPGS